MIAKWKKRELGDIATFFSGGTPSKSNPEYWGNDIPWITVRDMKAMYYSKSTLSLTEMGASTLRIMPAGTIYILVRGMGLFKDLPVLYCDRPATFNQDVKAIIPKDGTNPEFLAYSLVANKSQILRLVDRAGHGTGRLDTDLLKSVPFVIPPSSVQSDVVRILQTWDDAIENLEALCQAKLRRRDGVAQKLLASTQLIRKRKAKGWKITTFDEVFTERQDRNCGLASESVVTVGKYAIRKQSEHFTRSVASSDLSNYWLISPGDFVYDPMSAYYGALGQYTDDTDGVVSPAYRVIRLNEGVLPTFMVYLLRSRRIKFLLETRSSQGNREGKRRLLQRDEFANIDFLIPPLEEQCRIATILSAFENDLANTMTLVEEVKRQKRGLMQKLLTGVWQVTL